MFALGLKTNKVQSAKHKKESYANTRTESRWDIDHSCY
jgi:hypothetical protein